MVWPPRPSHDSARHRECGAAHHLAARSARNLAGARSPMKGQAARAPSAEMSGEFVGRSMREGLPEIVQERRYAMADQRSRACSFHARTLSDITKAVAFAPPLHCASHLSVASIDARWRAAAVYRLRASA